MLKFKVGDTVKITAGKDKGREGKIEKVFPKFKKPDCQNGRDNKNQNPTERWKQTKSYSLIGCMRKIEL